MCFINKQQEYERRDDPAWSAWRFWVLAYVRYCFQLGLNYLHIAHRTFDTSKADKQKRKKLVAVFCLVENYEFGDYRKALSCNQTFKV